MALADEEGDYEDPAVTSFVIRVGVSSFFCDQSRCVVVLLWSE